MSSEKQQLANISSRLLRLVNEVSEGNVSDFAKKAGLKQATLHNYTKGRLPSGDSLYYICNRLGVNINWLLTGDGAMFRSANEEQATTEPRDINLNLLTEVIEGVEQYLDAVDGELEPKYKAKLVTLLYDRFKIARENPTKKIISDYMSLVA